MVKHRISNSSVWNLLVLSRCGLGQETACKGASVMLPQVRGGRLTADVTQGDRVTLKFGKDGLGCPLQPAPDYPVVVQ